MSENPNIDTENTETTVENSETTVENAETIAENASSDLSDLSSWEQRMLERSLDSARVQALARSGEFVHAALALLEEEGSVEFTVQDVVQRSGGSLRRFYQLFSSKDDLVLALFEELITQLVEHIPATVQGDAPPLDRLEICVRTFWDFVRGEDAPPAKIVRDMAALHNQLAANRPEGLRLAWDPLRQLISGIIADGVADESIRSDIEVEELSELFFDVSLASHLFALGRVGATHARFDPLWAFCLGALRPPPER
ncbi:MAG: TetR/AcrR family transcriptional regulator [Acidimicrobiia bacterium]|nr:TetR/AcrR family transcriptional regulator [Acidimicrobiia bacterium]